MNKKPVGYARSRAQAEAEKDNRYQRNLLAAALKSGLEDIEEQFEIALEDGKSFLWIDLSGFHMGQQFCFDIRPEYHASGTPKHMLENLEVKKKWCLERQIPYEILPKWHSSMDYKIWIGNALRQWRVDNGFAKTYSPGMKDFKVSSE